MPQLDEKTRRNAERDIFERGHTVQWYDDGCICQDCGAIGYYTTSENSQSNSGNSFFGDIFTEECAAIREEMGVSHV